MEKIKGRHVDGIDHEEVVSLNQNVLDALHRTFGSNLRIGSGSAAVRKVLRGLDRTPLDIPFGEYDQPLAKLKITSKPATAAEE